jgi:DNA-binding CsgD family transcriptional regulator
MSLHLTTDDLARLQDASRALLSPLAAPSVDAWRAEVLRAVGDLLGADVGLFMLSTAPTVHFSDTLDPRFLAAYDRPVEGVGPDGVRMGDPVIMRWLCERRRHRQEVFDNASANALLAPYGMSLEESPLMVDGLLGAGVRDQGSMFVSFPGGEAMVQSGFMRNARRRLHGSALPVLELLVPAFAAAMHTLARLDAHRLALDVVDSPLAVFGPGGNELHRNAALSAVMERANHAAADLEAALKRLARQLHHPADPPAGPTAPATLVETPAGRYTLRGTLLAPGVFGTDACVMVTVAVPDSPVRPDAGVARERFGLTRREAEVALLAAAGLSNDAIAERLYISSHTARHHVEAVLAKVGVSSRSAIALRLVGAA